MRMKVEGNKSMKIIKKSEHIIEAKNLKVGDIFEILTDEERNVFMRVKSTGVIDSEFLMNIIVVNLVENEVKWVNPDTKVIVRKGTLTVED